MCDGGGEGGGGDGGDEGVSAAAALSSGHIQPHALVAEFREPNDRASLDSSR